MKRIVLPQTPRVSLLRDEHGLVHVQAAEEHELYCGMGYAHAMDRGQQILLMRILGRGQACQYLEDTDEMLQVDLFFRRMNWGGQTADALGALSERDRQCCLAYCDGINQYWQQHTPRLFKLLGYTPEPWTPADSIMLARMTGYLTLAQSQGELERFILQLIQKGCSREQLEALWGPLPELTEEHRLRLQTLRFRQQLVPESVFWHTGLSPMMSSNNWVVAPKHSASGQALFANDPHLEGNRLPNVWYEMALESFERYALCATMPGLPGLLLGRTQDLSWGATYSFMDAVDSWVEDCRAGCYRRGDDWLPFRRRREVIQRKHNGRLEVDFYENEHGVLDGNPHEAGLYLTTRWSGAESGAASLAGILDIWRSRSVPEGMRALGQLETAWNWVFADAQGQIGYQMSGLMPRRRAGVTGLIPLPGWEPENDWQGFEPPENLPRALNPDSGYLVTANHDLNALGQVSPINAPMGSYRAERIAQLLQSQSPLNAQQMQLIQQDVYSLQAERYLALLRPLLPDTPHGRLLKEWDCCYRVEQVEPTLFERFYRALCEELLRAQFGTEVASYLLAETTLVVDFYAQFDRVLMAERSPWFEGHRDALYRRVLAQSLEAPARPWGEVNCFELKHIVLGGKVPRLLQKLMPRPVDIGPLPLKGGRATPHQGQVFRSAGRMSSFMPTLRMVADLGEAGVYSSFLGGPSDVAASRGYAPEVKAWLAGQYKNWRALPWQGR